MGTKQILIVGAGFAGATIAYELAVNGYQVTVVDSRNHIGGNAYDYVNEYGITIHKYGPHIFHTDNDTVYNWLSQFTEWVEYKHSVVAKLDDGTLVPFPPTLDFVEKYGIDYVRDTFYIPYTKKMWGLDIDQIDDSILKRVPIRNDNGILYFPNAKYQCMPKHGYTKIFTKIFSHKNISVKLNTEFNKDMESNYFHIFNSMPIDVYYDYIYGKLPYRSIKFLHEHVDTIRVSTHTVVNFTDDGPHTRVVEWKNFPNHGENKNVSTLTYETPCDYKENEYERYYPVKDIQGVNRENYKKYKDIVNDKVTFIGRCGLYSYFDMDQAISSSLGIVSKFIELDK